MNQGGWTTWGWTDDKRYRIYKHVRGQMVALPADCPDPFILLSTMNDYLSARDEE